MRPAHLILTIAALGCSKATAGGREQPAPVPPPANGRQDTSRTTSGRGPAQEPAPKPYNQVITAGAVTDSGVFIIHRSEEHTSELQSHSDLVCRLLLEKKKKKPMKSINRM